MNRALFQLALQGLRRKKKSSLILFLVLFLSFAFAIITLSVNGSMAATNAEFKRDAYGNWDGAILNGIAAEDEEFLRNESWLAELAVVPQAGGIASLNPVTGEIMGISSYIGVWNDGFADMGRLEFQEGRPPENSDEIVLEARVLVALGKSCEVGQQISLPLAFRAGEHFAETGGTYTVCGVLKDYTTMWETEYYGGGRELSVSLDGAFITEDAAARLWEMAETSAKQKSSELGEDITLDREDTSYFFTVKPNTLNTMKTSVTIHHRQVSRSCTGVTLNGGSWANSEEAGYNAVYTVLIFAATFLSVLCVYAVQLQKQVRQITLFRSIGATHGQLGFLLLYETLCLCAPAALLGTAMGWFGTWAVLHLLVNASTMPIIVEVPWGLVVPLLLVWALVVFVARLFILNLAMREPLTGRMAMESKKSRRYRTLRTCLVSLLSILLCTTVLFSGLELFRHTYLMDYWAAQASYKIQMGGSYTWPYEYGEWPFMITNERLEQLRVIPGVSKTEARLILRAVPSFEGIEQLDYYFHTGENNEEYGFPNTHIDPWVGGSLAGSMGVLINALPEENWTDYLDLEKMGVDIDAFRKGEQIVLSFPRETDGDYIFYQWNDEFKTLYDDVWNARRVTDVLIQPGDHITLDFYGFFRHFLGTIPTNNPGELLKSVDVVVGGIQTFDPGAFEQDEWDTYGRFPYTVWCSEDFVKNVLSGMPPGNTIGAYYTGCIFGYMEAYLYTDDSADYLTTDKAVAEVLEGSGLGSTFNREYNMTQQQEEQQSIVLLAAGGGCLGVVLLMILSNTLAAEAQQERKRYGVLQALGMSKRQMAVELTRTALLRGLVSAAAGWAVFGGYVLLSAWKLSAEHPGRWAWALEETLKEYQVAGLNLPFCLALTLGAMIFVTAVTLLSKRQLFRENLMTKLREER